jgi:hypothetical protein
MAENIQELVGSAEKGLKSGQGSKGTRELWQLVIRDGPRKARESRIRAQTYLGVGAVLVITGVLLFFWSLRKRARPSTWS